LLTNSGERAARGTGWHGRAQWSPRAASTRKGIDLATRFPPVAAAIAALPVRSCVIDGEAIACDVNGLAVLNLLRYRRCDQAVTLCAFDLIEVGRQGCAPMAS
jgi:ATP-dependent DNA ligase